MRNPIIVILLLISILSVSSESLSKEHLLATDTIIPNNSASMDKSLCGDKPKKAYKLFKRKVNNIDEVFSIAFLCNGTFIFYGNTDLFNSAREGYTPGYFAVKMNDVKMNKNNISFNILVKKTDLCNDTTYNTLKDPYKNAEYIIPNRQLQIKIIFTGKIFNDQIILDTKNTTLSLPDNKLILTKEVQ